MIDIFEEDSRYLLSRLNLPNLEGTRILLTGSSGLIGKNILNFLNTLLVSQEFAFKVDALSMNSTHDQHRYHRNIVFKTGDLSLGLESFDLKKYNYIIHAATYGQPGKFTVQPLETLKLNGTLVIELAKHLDSQGTFLFLSSSEIYVGSESTPNVETDLGRLSIESPRAAYVYGKIFGEVALIQMRERFQIRIGRIALSYGPGTRLGDTRVLNQLIQRGITEGKVELADAGNALRTYSYVRDTSEMLLNILFWGKGEVYNVGGISSTSIRELGKEVSRILNVPFSFPSSSESYLDAPTQVQLDISKYTSEFGELQFLEFAEGLKRTIDWQKTNLFNLSL
jgi:nucleoside-diphosphate-sugar epimerase